MDILNQLAQAENWYYFGANFNRPCSNTIAIKPMSEQGEFAKASNVFQAMKLDLETLQHIFPNKHELVGDLTDYEQLGSCHKSDHTAWSALAKLSGKKIHLTICQDGHPVGKVSTIYDPDGQIKKL